MTLAVCLTGELDRSAHGGRGRRLVLAQELATAAGIGEPWCQVPDSVCWVEDWMGWSQVDSEAERRGLLDLIVSRESIAWGWQRIGPDLARGVRMLPNMYMSYAITPTGSPVDWRAAVAELTPLLEQLAPHCVYGFITADTFQTPSWGSLVRSPWRISGDFVNAPGVVNAVTEEHKISVGHAVQLLGPGHAEVDLPTDRWETIPVGDTGHRIVTARDLDAWAPGRLTIDLLVQAETDFGDLVQPTMNRPNPGILPTN